MDNKSRVTINMYNGRYFEKFATPDQETGTTQTSYAVDGVEMEQEEWTRRQDEAITRDMVDLGLKDPRLWRA